MAVGKPLYINAVDYDAEAERRGFSGLLAQAAPGVARSGVLGPAPEVTLSGSTVQVGPFHAAISSAKGAYLLAVDSVTSAGTLGVADQTNGRLDRIVLEVLDPDNGSVGTERMGRLRVIPGEARALPGLPPLPPLTLHIGSVQVPKVTGGNPVVTVDCRFTATAGAPVPVRSELERDALDPNMVREVLRLDNGGTDFSMGGKWVSQIMGLAGTAGWRVIGVVERSRISPTNTRNRLSMKLRRIGGSFSIGAGSGATTLTGAVVPVEVRPPEPIDVPVTYMSSALTYGGSGVIRIETSGAITAYPTAPTSSINLTTNGFFNVSAEWIL